MQLRVFEKRYQLMLRAAIEAGGCFGFPCNGLGVTAVVRRWVWLLRRAAVRLVWIINKPVLASRVKKQ